MSPRSAPGGRSSRQWLGDVDLLGRRDLLGEADYLQPAGDLAPFFLGQVEHYSLADPEVSDMAGTLRGRPVDGDFGSIVHQERAGPVLEVVLLDGSLWHDAFLRPGSSRVDRLNPKSPRHPHLQASRAGAATDPVDEHTREVFRSIEVECQLGPTDLLEPGPDPASGPPVLGERRTAEPSGDDRWRPAEQQVRAAIRSSRCGYHSDPAAERHG